MTGSLLDQVCTLDFQHIPDDNRGNRYDLAGKAIDQLSVQRAMQKSVGAIADAAMHSFIAALRCSAVWCMVDLLWFAWRIAAHPMAVTLGTFGAYCPCCANAWVEPSRATSSTV